MDSTDGVDSVVATPGSLPVDKYGRVIALGTPLGCADKAWRSHYGIGGKDSKKTSLLGENMGRDSFLPLECKLNEKRAVRDTPRSSKLTKEILKWAERRGYTSNDAFMQKLRRCAKRVQPLETLGISQREVNELRPLIYKRASYSLLDKTSPAPHFTTSTREQMTKATLWSGDSGTPATDAFYFPDYSPVDPRVKVPPMSVTTREQMQASQMWRGVGATKPNPIAYNPSFKLLDARQPAFSFGTSERPEIFQKNTDVLYNVPIENDPRFLKRYKTFGAKYQSFGPRRPTKSRMHKKECADAANSSCSPSPSTEGGEGHTQKRQQPTRFGLVLSPSLKYHQYKLYG